MNVEIKGAFLGPLACGFLGGLFAGGIGAAVGFLLATAFVLVLLAMKFGLIARTIRSRRQ